MKSQGGFLNAPGHHEPLVLGELLGVIENPLQRFEAFEEDRRFFHKIRPGAFAPGPQQQCSSQHSEESTTGRSAHR